MNAIFRAAQQGNLDYFSHSFAKTELRKEIFECSHSKSGDSVMHFAVRFGHLPLVKFLLSEGFNIEVSNFDGKRPLHEAALYGKIECLKYLLQNGAKIDSLKRADWTPLMLACTKDSLEVVTKLLEHGADAALKNKDGWNCFHIATREGHMAILQHLLSHDPSLWQTVSKNGRSPLHTAALHGLVEVVHYLLEKCDYRRDVKDSCGTTPFMDAIRVQNTDIAKLLIEKQQVNVGEEDNLGRQALHIGAQAGATKSIQFLVEECGIFPDTAASKLGSSALHIAAKEGQTEAMLLLLSLGVDMNILDNKGRTALHIAAGAQHTDCVSTLLQRGADCRRDQTGTLPQELARKPDLVELMNKFAIQIT